MAFHKRSACALHDIIGRRSDEDGSLLVLFSGYHHLRDARRALARADDVHVEGEVFELALLADQPDRRRQLRTWTRCSFTQDDGKFKFGQHIGLVHTFRLTFDAYWSHGWCMRLRAKAKHYIVHALAYDDVPGEPHAMKDLRKQYTYIYIYIYIYI